MAGVEKIVEKMKRQPNGIRPEEAEKVLKAYEYKYKRQKDSHRHYLHQNGDLITVKIETPLKAVYIKNILNRIGE
jgi:predicted RNA binding protein YcfA (HicA-like mRNA interferase family)